jgi:predicted phage terminase large subunit-like protein
MTNSLPSLPASQNLSPRQTAAAELLTRRRTRQSLTDWARHCGYEPAAHHRLLIKQLERVVRGDCDRLIVCMPPGAAKSTYVSVLFPAFFLASHPTASIIAASHTTELSERFGRRVRNLIIENSPMLGIELSSDSQAAGRWQLRSGGDFLAAGVGQAILGFRADIAIIDDPVRSREDAASEHIRRSTWEWFSADLKTRLKPGGRVILIMTRWHEDDIAGRLLAEAERGGEKWDTCILPAVADENDPLGRKPGEFLWDSDPNYQYGQFLRREQQTQPSWNWSALYQQRPTPETGEFFEAAWLKPYDKIPKLDTLRVFGGTDYAVMAGKGDYTCLVVVGVARDQSLWLLDLWRRQTTPDVWVEQLLYLQKLWRPIAWGEERGQIAYSVGPLIDRRVAQTKTPIFRKAFTPKADKPTRAQAIRGHIAMHGLHVPTKASWYAAFAHELLSFPVSKHDDQVDALAMLGQLLPMMAPQVKPTKEKKLGLERYGLKDGSYQPFVDDAQMDKWLSNGDPLDDGGAYHSILTL